MKTLQMNFVCDHTSSANKCYIDGYGNSPAFSEDLLYDHCCSICWYCIKFPAIQCGGGSCQ